MEWYEHHMNINRKLKRIQQDLQEIAREMETSASKPRERKGDYIVVDDPDLLFNVSVVKRPWVAKLVRNAVHVIGGKPPKYDFLDQYQREKLKNSKENNVYVASAIAPDWLNPRQDYWWNIKVVWTETRGWHLMGGGKRGRYLAGWHRKEPRVGIWDHDRVREIEKSIK